MQSLRQYSTFESVSELNTSIDYYLDHFNFTPTEKHILITLSRHSVKICGVSWLKHKTLSSIVERSESTVRAVLRKFKDLGIIKRIECHRPIKGGNGASLTVILSPDTITRQNAEDVDKDYDLKPIGTNETINYKTTYKQKDIDKRMDEPFLDHSFVPSYIPESFSKAVKPFFNDTKRIVKLWQSASVCFFKNAGLSYGIPESATNMVIDAFKQAIYQKYKNSKKNVKTDIGGYFYGVLRKMISDYMKQLQLKQIIPLLYPYWEQKGRLSHEKQR